MSIKKFRQIWKSSIIILNAKRVRNRHLRIIQFKKNENISAVKYIFFIIKSDETICEKSYKVQDVGTLQECPQLQ